MFCSSMKVGVSFITAWIEKEKEARTTYRRDS